MEVEEFINDIEPDELEPDEEYASFCGEVFLTNKGIIIFHCICKKKLQGFVSYENHLKDEHLEPKGYQDKEDLKFASVKNISEEIQISPYYQDSEEISQGFCENYSNIEVLEEEEMEFRLSEHIDDINTIRRRINNNSKKEKVPIANDKNDILSKQKQFLEEEDEEKPDGELLSCDRPILKSSRKPITSLTDNKRKHKCPYCPFASKDKTNLRSHKQRHSNNKPHQCSFCPKNFHTRVELTFHTRYHTGERPFLCTECGRTFVTKEQLKQHMKRHWNQRDHQCSECEKQFFSAQELREHMTVHTKETPYKCDLCGGAFSRRKALTAHKKLHENKRSYKCQLCNAGFNQSAGLYLHFKTKHHLIKQNNAEKISESVRS